MSSHELREAVIFLATGSLTLSSCTQAIQAGLSNSEAVIGYFPNISGLNLNDPNLSLDQKKALGIIASLTNTNKQSAIRELLLGKVPFGDNGELLINNKTDLANIIARNLLTPQDLSELNKGGLQKLESDIKKRANDIRLERNALDIIPFMQIVTGEGQVMNILGVKYEEETTLFIEYDDSNNPGSRAWAETGILTPESKANYDLNTGELIIDNYDLYYYNQPISGFVFPVSPTLYRPVRFVPGDKGEPQMSVITMGGEAKKYAMNPNSFVMTDGGPFLSLMDSGDDSTSIFL